MEKQFLMEKMFGQFVAGFEVPAVEYSKKPELPNKTDFAPRPTDIVVTGPLKVGTTWVQQILHQMRTGGDESFQNIFDVTWWLPFFFTDNPTGFDYTKDQPANPRVFKCHAPFERQDKVAGMKFITMMRDPMDAIVSSKNFLAGLYGFDGNTPFGDKIIEFAIKSKFATMTGSYANLASWYPHSNDPNVFVLPYEDLKKDLPECIKKLSEFTEIPMDDDLFDLVVERSSFKYMSEHSEKFMPTYRMFGSVLRIDEELFNPKHGMVRKSGGRSGEGRKETNMKVLQLADKQWRERYQPIHGFETYQELYDSVSCLKN